jgi:antitoxin component of MazEF toxin-antitoxin module
MLCMAKDITLRQVGRVSLGMTLPVEFIRSLELQAGDIVSWSAEGDTATLKFTRHGTPAMMEQQEEAVADTT